MKKLAIYHNLLACMRTHGVENEHFVCEPHRVLQECWYKLRLRSLITAR